MGLLDKLKNVFFEEEYVEVEEPVKKEKVTVARKIETPEVKRVREEVVIKEKEEEVPVSVSDNTKEFEKEEQHDYRFPMDFDDKDFIQDRPVVEKEEEVPIPEPVQVKEVVEVYKEKKVYEEPIEYHTTNYQGLYEGSERKDKRANFTPSPIISPIYGILDKNYKKEEIVTKKEIRLSVTPKNVDLDYVREKAYGDLANDITESIHEEVKEKEEEKTPVVEDNLLYDLNDDEDSPAVKVVTVGDAYEYFNDLGLEYNVDYKVEKEKKEEEERPTRSRRIERKREEDFGIDIDDEKPKKPVSSASSTVESKTRARANSRAVEEETNSKINSDSDNDSNLFDLIDSMYEDKE